MAVQLGNLAEWVTGAAIVGAVVFTGVSVRQASRANRDAQRDAAFDEAAVVSLAVTSAPRNRNGKVERAVVVDVVNNGRRPIFDVWVRLLDLDGRRLDEWWLPAVPPLHSQPRLHDYYPPEPSKIWSGTAPPKVSGTITFRDSNRHEWVNLGDGYSHRLVPGSRRRWWYRWRVPRAARQPRT